jgi:hypothetical protein
MAVKRIAPALSTADVLDRVLDKGIVIEAEIRIAVAGIELVTVSALVRVASFETWERHVASAEARRRSRPLAADGEAAATHRVRLRCESGCTFERRASVLAVRDGALAPQRCVLKTRRACPVTVV